MTLTLIGVVGGRQTRSEEIMDRFASNARASARIVALLAALAIGTVVSFAARTAHADARIESKCLATGTGTQCVFANTGSDAGQACITVTVTRKSTGGSTRSDKLCSGSVKPSESKSLSLTFAGQSPAELCLAGARPSWADCALDVQLNSVTADTSPLVFLMWLVVVGTSFWVYFDARRIGARKGLTPGMGNMNPGGWLLACLVLWIVGFPMYLAKRGAIRRAVADGQQRVPIAGGAQPVAYAPAPVAAAYGSPAAFAPGARVQVLAPDGQQYPAVIAQASAGQFLCVMPNGQQLWLPASHVRAG